jgi:predicted dinucleotide-binding enzyme
MLKLQLASSLVRRHLLAVLISIAPALALMGTAPVSAATATAVPTATTPLKIGIIGPVESRDGPMALEVKRKGAGIATAEYLNNKRVVRAFNSISFKAIATDSFRQPARRAIPIGGDDAAALAVASRLVSDAGFDPVVIGSLARTREFDLGEPLASHDWTVKDYQPYFKK